MDFIVQEFMRKLPFFPSIRHAFVMVKKNIRSYALLSVTVVLSFALLLGYLLYTDASLYNKHKEILSRRRGDVLVKDFNLEDQKIKVLLDNLSEIENTTSYVVYQGSFGHHTSTYTMESNASGETVPFGFANLHAEFIPDYAWIDSFSMIPSLSSEIVWHDGEEHTEFFLDTDEVILSEKLYFALRFDEEAEPVFNLRSGWGINLSFRVVGYWKSEEVIDYSDFISGHSTPPMILSTKLINAIGLLEPGKWAPDIWQTFGRGIIDQRCVVVHSDNPEAVVQLAQTMNLSTESVYEQQEEALAQIRTEKGNKAIIACALLLLLGINLYSSFTNALSERKFEIGVKRAIGASAWSIVLQFLYESIIVMLANILVAVAVVADVFIVYKYIYERTPDEWGMYNDFILYISPHSVAMFALCAVTLTIVFSLIFAYKSTRVEIVKYLKAE